MSDWVNAGAAVVVAVFAVLQVVVMWKDSRRRMRVAYNVVWAEWNRLMQLDRMWDQSDLILRADKQVLATNAVLPLDSSLLSSQLAELGHDAARYGGSARTFLGNAEENLRMIIAATSATPLTDRTDKQVESLRGVEAKAKKALKESVHLLEDAMACAPAYIRNAKVDLGDPQSELGQRLKAEFARREKRWRRFLPWAG